MFRNRKKTFIYCFPSFSLLCYVQGILCARSAHFRAMFTSGMRESREALIELKADVMTKVSWRRHEKPVSHRI